MFADVLILGATKLMWHTPGGHGQQAGAIYCKPVGLVTKYRGHCVAMYAITLILAKNMQVP